MGISPILVGLLVFVGASFAETASNSTSPIIIKKFAGKMTTEKLKVGTVDVYRKELTITDASDLLRISAEVVNPEDFEHSETPILQVTVSNGRDEFLLKLPVTYPNLTIYSYGKLLNPLMRDDFGKFGKRKNKTSENELKTQNLVVTVQSRLHVDIAYKLYMESMDRSQYHLNFKPEETEKVLSNQHLTFLKPMGFYLDAEEQNVHSFRIQVTSSDDICAKLITVPANESIYDRSVDSDEIDNRRSITFSKRADVFFSASEIEGFKKFRIFAFINPDDSACSSNTPRKSFNQNKKLTFEFQKLEPQSYATPILAMLGFFFTPVLILGPFFILRVKRAASGQTESQLISFSASASHSPIPSEYAPESREETFEALPQHTEEPTNPDVVDTSPSPPDSLLFYGEMLRFPVAVILPILMHTALEFHKWTTSTMANRDEMCFHNHACSLPFGELRAWNNIVSNIGFAIYGFAFVVITMKRRRRLSSFHGFGTHECTLFDVTIGVFMVLQAIASATYHICPNDVAFQFDTPCIQMICGLLILRQWLVRLESPSAAYSNILLVFIFSLNFLVSALSKSSSVIFLIAFLHSSVVIGVCLAKKKLLARHGLERFQKQVACGFILTFSVFNFIMMLVYTTSSLIHLNQISTYVFILNCVLYLVYYASMKAVFHEKLAPVSKIYGLLAIFGWLVAVFFFFQEDTDWTTSAAASRALNKPCLLFNFFGSHDLWHIFGAFAGLFTFLFVSFVDDDLLNVASTSLQPF